MAGHPELIITYLAFPSKWKRDALDRAEETLENRQLHRSPGLLSRTVNTTSRRIHRCNGSSSFNQSAFTQRVANFVSHFAHLLPFERPSRCRLPKLFQETESVILVVFPTPR